jgi:hypothetical protein
MEEKKARNPCDPFFFHGHQTCNASIFDPTITPVQKLIKYLPTLIPSPS